MDGFRESNAMKHDLTGMLAVALLSSLHGGRTCGGMAGFAAAKEDLRRSSAAVPNVESAAMAAVLARVAGPVPLRAQGSRNHIGSRLHASGSL